MAPIVSVSPPTYTELRMQSSKDVLSRKAARAGGIVYCEASVNSLFSANQAQLKIGDLTIANKRGWDYLWVSYKTAVAANGKSLVKKPAAAYVEKVYPDGDFSTLGI